MKQFKSILELVTKFPTEQACIEYLELLRWNGDVVSPFDPESKVYNCKGNRYKCKNTGKYFNAKVGTIFEDTKIPLQKWFIALYLVSSHKKGISSHQLARDIDTTQKTAWFILHRLRYALEHESFNKEMKGTIEVDETYIGGDLKNMHKSKKEKLGTKRGGSGHRKPVLGMIERESGTVKAMTIGNSSAIEIKPILYKKIHHDSTMVTDGYPSYNGIDNVFSNHVRIHHAKGEYVVGAFHTNTIEGFWSILKRGIIGIYHFVSVKHLERYLTEFTFRYNTRGMNEDFRFNMALANVGGKRLKYHNLIAK